MKSPFHPLPDDAAARQAAEWFIELETGSPSLDKQTAFADWLRRSPVHVEQFLQCMALRGDLAHLPEVRQIDVEALLAQAPPDNLIALDAAAAAPPRAPFVAKRRWPMAAAA